MHPDSSFSVTSHGSLPWLQLRTTTTTYPKKDTRITHSHFHLVKGIFVINYSAKSLLILQYITLADYNLVKTTLQNNELGTKM